MADVLKLLAFLGLVFLTMTFVINMLLTNFPRIPGDIYIDRPGGLKIYIPFTSALILSAILTIFFNYFR